VVYRVERNRYVVTLSGVGRDYPPTDEEGFLEFARSLPIAQLYDILHQARPISAIAGYRHTENSRRHYERLPRWPEGFVVLGDAVCTFNPLYAQGMTVAVLGAQVLDHCLRRQHSERVGHLARHVQRELARVDALPWLMATGEDFRHPATVGGHRSWMTRLVQWYLDQVLALATDHPSTYLAFAAVLHLVHSPVSLVRPSVVGRVVGHALHPWLTRTNPARSGSSIIDAATRRSS
jgi:2-polyprenyl-6-methoxyphenol hydroxylase-like FAD-dependent oxidoreductase